MQGCSEDRKTVKVKYCGEIPPTNIWFGADIKNAKIPKGKKVYDFEIAESLYEKVMEAYTEAVEAERKLKQVLDRVVMYI